MGKLNAAEQLETLHTVLGAGWVKTWGVAVDGGANVGDWSAVLSGRFGTVHAFEPDPNTLKQLDDRMDREGLFNVTTHPCALLHKLMPVRIVDPTGKGKSRSFHVEPTVSSDIFGMPLDGLALPSCGLLKLDLEGAEVLALIGAGNTIREFKPVLIVELDSHLKRFGYNLPTALRYIESIGYREVMERGPDRVFVPA